MQLPPCGIYRTRAPIGSIPPKRLVFFHNHGDPGPGVYLPAGWDNNRVRWQTQGTTLHDPSLMSLLEPLPPEGLYRVLEAFFCCAKQCRRFEPETLVELGYNADAQAIVFLPERVDGVIAVPTSGTAVDDAALGKLKLLKVQLALRERDASVH